MSIRVMVAEDERLAREELVYLLEQEDGIEILPQANNGRELLQYIEQFEPDVIFVDIQMPEISGLQAARMLSSRKNPPMIVFTTAHEDYAVEAFGLNALDYLLKPYDHHRLKETINRIRSRMLPKAKTDEALSPKASNGRMQGTPGRFTKLVIDDGSRKILIDPAAILYAERDERSVHIHTTDQKYSTKMTLQQLEERLHEYPFFRPHRSYLVNLNMILELVPWFNGAYNVILKDHQRTQIPVSRSSVKDLLDLLES
ncbi:LytR/AlgR family response regulator transcription factor [Ferviditalea candida]|uniref:LytTR family DNA-binding domain-containing protein n=1 Tax=Ferviditalea candida TaxID=3108399 RepID=A0ABU5ZGG6_9BACL|nr:LytTR family DNA-binding domain-containing protein [Paenibacillaceae bacterium T2]